MRAFKQPEQLIIAGITFLFVAIAVLYSITVPIFEVSDELRHYPMVKTLADGNGLPIQDPTSPGPWRQEGSQPPLYYALGAAATFWIDTSDFEQVWRLNPHVDNGIIKPDGNVNMVVHNYAAEKWPWQGTVLAVHIVRLLSVVISAGAVIITYQISVYVFPHQKWIGLAAAAVTAFTPMFVFISGSVNNDNLATLLAAISVWLMLRILRMVETGSATLRSSIWLGLVLGLAALTKQSTLGLIGLAGITMAYAAYRQKRWQTFFIEGPLIIGSAALLAGWWYLRNWRLYGEVFGLQRMIDIAGARPGGIASLAQLWGERTGFVYSYWGLFGGVNIPMALWVYPVLIGLSIISLIGLSGWVSRTAQREGFAFSRWMPRILVLLWVPFVFIPLVRWTSLTQASQGRLLFSAISALSLWFVVGLAGWLPERWGKLTAAIVVGFLGILSILAPPLWIGPEYQSPAQMTGDAQVGLADFSPPENSAPAIRLVTAGFTPSESHPGEQIEVALEWEVLASMNRNWSVFVHLQDSVHLLAGQRDTYPGVGLLATSDLQAGRRWRDTLIIPIRESAYTPETLEVRIGLYDVVSGERMIALNGSDSVLVGAIELLPRDGDVPNPVSYNYGGKMLLRGYEISSRTAAPGEYVDVTLYWESLKSMEENYSISVQVVDETGAVGGAKDSWPADGSRPTITWEPGETLTDSYQVSIAENALPGVYDIEVIVYSVDGFDGITKLKRLMPGGRLVDDRILLTKIWIIS